MLNNKIVIITGGAGLLGQEFVRAVIQKRGIAVIADINIDNGHAAQKKLSNELQSSNIDFVQLDITSKNSITEMLDILSTKYGRIDALVNNAYPRNKSYGQHFFQVEFSDFCENINLHLGGYFLTSQQVAVHFQKQGYGNIINISSIYGCIAPRFNIYDNTLMTMPIEYAAIKSAIIQLTKYMAKYFKGMNIRVNTLSPGGIFDGQPTQFLEAYRKYSLNKGMLDKSDICGTLIFLLSDESKFINGQNIVIDDGFSL